MKVFSPLYLRTSEAESHKPCLQGLQDNQTIWTLYPARPVRGASETRYNIIYIFNAHNFSDWIWMQSLVILDGSLTANRVFLNQSHKKVQIFFQQSSLFITML